jgi:hypothetical protein
MTSDAVNPHKKDSKSDELARRELSPEQAAAAAMVAEARQRGLELTGPDGLLKLFTKNVLEPALDEELAEHLGYEKAGLGRGAWTATWEFLGIISAIRMTSFISALGGTIFWPRPSRGASAAPIRSAVISMYNASPIGI